MRKGLGEGLRLRRSEMTTSSFCVYSENFAYFANISSPNLLPPYCALAKYLLKLDNVLELKLLCPGKAADCAADIKT